MYAQQIAIILVINSDAKGVVLLVVGCVGLIG